MSSRYRIQWEIDLEASSPQEAAREALEIHRDPESIALVFQVINERGRKEGHRGQSAQIDLDRNRG